MARAKVDNLDKAIDSVFRKYKSNLKRAVEYATNKAEDDIYGEAYSCLYQYYDNYNPKWYGRTDSLIKSFVTVNEITENEDSITARVGVFYDPSRLDGVYHTEASENSFFDPVDPTWVLKNYLAGIHPRTNGYPLWNIKDGAVIYNPVIDTISPDSAMQTYINQYKNTFDKNVLWWLANKATKR